MHVLAKAYYRPLLMLFGSIEPTEKERIKIHCTEAVVTHSNTNSSLPFLLLSLLQRYVIDYKMRQKVKESQLHNKRRQESEPPCHLKHQTAIIF